MPMGFLTGLNTKRELTRKVIIEKYEKQCACPNVSLTKGVNRSEESSGTQ